MIVYINDLSKKLNIKSQQLHSKFSRLKKYGLEKTKNSNGYYVDDILMAIDTRLLIYTKNQMGDKMNEQLYLIKDFLLGIQKRIA